MAYIDFLTPLHKKTERNYLKRMYEFPKSKAIEIAKQYGYEYWDGDRKFGYGGYKYDGRWQVVAEAMIKHYHLKAGDRILDIGCGKAFLLYEFLKINPELKVYGIDISEYAINNSIQDVKPYLQIADASNLQFKDNSFDLVFSINTLHNLYCYDLVNALTEIERVAKKNKYIVVESYRNEIEKVNLMCWVLTGECFFTPDEWQWWFDLSNYAGDHSFIYFE